MAIRDSSAVWKETLSREKTCGSSVLMKGNSARFHALRMVPGTNPEELIGAAHAGCFSMFLAAILSKDGHEPTSINTAPGPPGGGTPKSR